MGKAVRSARGQMVDFDLLRIKQQIASHPASNEVRVRQDFIEKKINRRTKKVSYPKAPTLIPAVIVEPVVPTVSDGGTPVAVENVSVIGDSTIKQKARPHK